jgi:hypothetical protein
MSNYFRITTPWDHPRRCRGHAHSIGRGDVFILSASARAATNSGMNRTSRGRASLAFRVMNGSAGTLPDQQARLQHAGERGFDGVAAGSGGGDDGRHRDETRGRVARSSLIERASGVSVASACCSASKRLRRRSFCVLRALSSRVSEAAKYEKGASPCWNSHLFSVPPKEAICSTLIPSPPGFGMQLANSFEDVEEHA